MTQLARVLLCLVLLLEWSVSGQERPAAASGLPGKRVVLYKNGGGYFEHLGQVRDNQSFTISFTTGQLNDVLKSLTVLDLGGGRIAGVAYGSSAPVEKQLGDLRLPLGEKSTLTEFLGALRGARIEVKNGTSVITGRLLSIERKTRISGGTTLEVDYLSLIADGGEVRTTELSPAFSVRLLEPGLADRVGRFLDVISAGREADVRRMVVATEGTGERSVLVSYISEVPVWKATYRIVLGSKPGQSPLLQGWAIVDNTVGQDWEKVQLSLVAGAPQSFIQNLSQPYYSRRPVVPLPQSVTGIPQTYEATLMPGGARLTGKVTDPSGAAVPGATVSAYDASGMLVGQTRTSLAGTYELPSLPEGTLRLQVEAPGFRRADIADIAVSAGRPAQRDARMQIGSTSETVTVSSSAPGLNASMASRSGTTGSGRALGSAGGGVVGGIGRGTGIGTGSGGGVGGGLFTVDTARASAQAAALAQELGDLFEYKLKEPITIPKNGSALVPIIQSSVVADKVSIWNDQAGLSRPLRGLWITNTSGLTLDGGSFSVMDEETFAGEGVIEPIRPGEKRLVSYAADLALTASSTQVGQPQRVTRVRVSKGVMVQESEIRETKTYTFRNQDSAPRSVIVEHPVRPGFELRSQVRPAESTAAWMRFRLQVEPNQTASLVVEEGRPVRATYSLSTMTSDQVGLFVQQRSIDKTLEDALRRILAQRAAVEDLDGRRSALAEEKQQIFDDQQRLRENLKALKGTAEERALVQRYTQQLNEQESRLEALRKQAQQLNTEWESAKSALDKMVEEISFDLKL